MILIVCGLGLKQQLVIHDVSGCYLEKLENQILKSRSKFQIYVNN
jgi:hypothetical protein